MQPRGTQVLATKGANKKPYHNIGSSTEGEKTAALRVLRFLDTPASVHELVLRLGTHGDLSDWNEIAGLAGIKFLHFACFGNGLV